MKKIFNNLFLLWKFFKNDRKKQFGYFIGLTTLSSLMEVISIGAIFPFLIILSASSITEGGKIIELISNILSINDVAELRLALTILFCSAILIAGALRVYLLRISTKLCFSAGADISCAIYGNAIHMPYEAQVKKNSSLVISGISTKSHIVINLVLWPCLNIISNIFLLVFIMALLLSINWILVVSIFGVFTLLYLSLFKLSRKSLLKSSEIGAKEATNSIKLLQEGLGASRDILMGETQEIFYSMYKDSELKLRSAQGLNIFINSSPRYVIEAIGIFCLVSMAYFFSLDSNGIDSAIPMIGVLALASQRLLPIIQQLYGGITSIVGNKYVLDDILILLDGSEIPGKQNEDHDIELPFTNHILFQDLSYKYDLDAPWIFRNINLKIQKGSIVGVVGESGAGKSTLIDLLMTLLNPTEGIIKVDDVEIDDGNKKCWRKNIAHVSQSTFLLDASIKQNIAFGIPESLIDMELVIKCAEKVRMSELIESWTEGYESKVGERGALLSGGQVQRIGIARALYKRAMVLVLDEATSALDDATEDVILDVLDGMRNEFTIVLVSHRLSTLKICDRVIKLISPSNVLECKYIHNER